MGFFGNILNPFRGLRRRISHAYLGIDIGTTSIKVVEMRRGKTAPQVANYAYLEAGDYLGRSNSALQSSTLKLFDRDVIEFLRTSIRTMRTNVTDVIASLPLFSAFLTVLTFPEMPQKDLEKAFGYQVRRFIPLPISEVSIDWRKMSEYEDERGFKQQQILLISIPNEQIRKYQNIFSAVGLNLRLLELESMSAVRVLGAGDPTPTIIVDIGSRSSTFSFVEGGELRFASQTDYAGASLTQALASSLSINPRRAEELKRDKGILAEGADFELSTIIIPHLDVIVNEVKRAAYSYKTQVPQARDAERVVLTGGGANLRGFEAYMSRELGIPAVKAAPFLKFEYPPVVEPVIGELDPLLVNSLGLGAEPFLR